MGSLHHAGQRDAIIRRLRSLEADDKPRWGSLTAGKMLSHLIDSFALSAGRKEWHRTCKGFTLQPFGQWLTIRSPLPWPKGLKVPDLFFESEPTNFSADRDELIQAIEAYANKPENQTWGVSPEFGRLTPKQWGQLNFRHCQHHLKQFGR